MEHVVSQDGTPIAFARYGSGPPLVVVHGGVADHSRWAPVAEGLARSFTVLAMDRRGRGGSGDSDAYDLSLEYQDVAALVRHAGDGAFLLGHSYGAVCALGAAGLAENLERLILYEPPVSPSGHKLFEDELLERFETFLQNGDRNSLLEAFYREIVHLPEDALATMRKRPSWQGRIDAAHTILREGQALRGFVYNPEAYTGLDVPTLLLIGGESSPAMTEAAKRLAIDLPDASLTELPGQDHVAMDTAPDMFVGVVTGFLK